MGECDIGELSYSKKDQGLVSRLCRLFKDDGFR